LILYRSRENALRRQSQATQLREGPPLTGRRGYTSVSSAIYKASLELDPQVPDSAQRVSLGTAQTDASGAYIFSLAPQATAYELWVDYAGATTMWPASARKCAASFPVVIH
jgi:hypothetical protein